MSVLREYIEQVVTELKVDHKFVKLLKVARDRKKASSINIDKLVDDWLARNSQLRLKPQEIRVAHRIAYDKFPELFDKFRDDAAAAKKALFISLSMYFKSRIAK